MPPYTNIPLSPAELSYLHTSLSSTPPIRPDGRTPTQFRPLVAETAILPTANGSARVCFSDGTEAIVGVKAEVEKTRGGGMEQDVNMGGDDGNDEGKGEVQWLQLGIDIPGLRDDDALPVFLGAMLREALLADGGLAARLNINARFHWRLYVDILLLSPPLSYPLPLLSLTTHLALLSTRLPALVSQGDEDPLFNDDWQASLPLYPSKASQPPITLLVISVQDTILFDPSVPELAVADAVLAISVLQTPGSRTWSVVAIRTVDPPSRLTAAGVPSSLGSAGGAVATATNAEVLLARERDEIGSVWRPPRGGVGRKVIARMVKMVVESGGVADEVMGGLEGVEIGMS
ncbi:hypothetical protein B0A48_02799 [Cryoendolithus antarcticus]|uniref:Ribosomal RNA-processing protein 42 n=1 Tax=Cryoendolithus antarcticus TaxID=1507870 RepID=A0A1V8TLA9_9PEZI|nr:hypothetical protein B0A48_02799 [Cryoendolithus antarcticus]